jgi:hypothetical protein
MTSIRIPISVIRARSGLDKNKVLPPVPTISSSGRPYSSVFLFLFYIPNLFFSVWDNKPGLGYKTSRIPQALPSSVNSSTPDSIAFFSIALPRSAARHRNAWLWTITAPDPSRHCTPLAKRNPSGKIVSIDDAGAGTDERTSKLPNKSEEEFEELPSVLVRSAGAVILVTSGFAVGG